MDFRKRHELSGLIAVILLGLLLRLFSGRHSLVENGILLGGYDEYYHMRRILYTVNHFPSTLWFDSYLGYPRGMNLTWPPLFDQLSAALALALGQHTQPGVEMAASFLPVILGATAVAIVYYMIREIFDGKTALLAAFMTAIAPYHILKTMIAATDHHGLEVLLLLASLLFMVQAFTRRSQGRIFAAAAGVMMAGLAYTWFGADIYLGIFLVYAAVQMIFDLMNGISSKETTTALLTAFGVALIFVLPFWNAPWLFPSFLGMAAMVVAILVMFAISRLMAGQKVHWIIFALTIFALAFIFIISSKLLGGLFGLNRLVQYGANYLFGSGMSGKIAEAGPLFPINLGWEYILNLLGWDFILNFLFSLAGIAVLIIHLSRADAEKRSGQLLLMVWIISSLFLTVVQVRFLYLYTIAIGILISILFFWALDVMQKRTAQMNWKVPKALAIALLLLLILPTSIETTYITYGVPSITEDWHESLIWLKENSNSTSFYDSPEKIPEYSVMSWWDYGNWVVYVARRPVVANNFQTGVEDSAKFYLSESEAISTAVLDKRRARYILTDYELLYGKLPAIVAWTNEDLSSYLNVEGHGPSLNIIPTTKWANTTLARLYFLNGAGMGHFRLIHESSTNISNTTPESRVKIFEYVPGALIRVSTGQDQRVGALLNLTSNRGRDFKYINDGLPKDGKYEIRVPYSTECSYGTRALGPYAIFSENEKGVKMKSINVSEKDVLEGKVIDVSFGSGT